MTCPASSFLMGLSAWLVWAGGGFRTNPASLGLDLAQLALTLFGVGATRVGLMVCLGILGTQIGCFRKFKRMNPLVGNLISPSFVMDGFSLCCES
ncbi:hypothetical protein L6164_010209 [Bauhinia variegata]|uniref:Uncharacterized protein n=1 Tax=Bauhinia variegata TaxID=167791 RepID=A0ACB9PLJ5_BAUVA|nr:hypothetical protein L6164_010209 [Bauhinia variegata]